MRRGRDKVLLKVMIPPVAVRHRNAVGPVIVVDAIRNVTHRVLIHVLNPVEATLGNPDLIGDGVAFVELGGGLPRGCKASRIRSFSL